MIVFFPRDIGMWRKDFDFHPDITLVPKEKTDHKAFRDRGELIQFLKEHGVRLDDAKFPLRIEKTELYFPKPRMNFYVGELFMVHQCTVLGWIKDDYK